MSATDIMDIKDQARIELTLNARESIIREMMPGGRPPVDKENRAFLMQALDGLDRTVLTKAKIKSDDTAAKTQADSARVIADFLLRVDSKRLVTGHVTDVEAHTLPDIDLVEGETSIGVTTFKYKDLIEASD